MFKLFPAVLFVISIVWFGGTSARADMPTSKGTCGVHPAMKYADKIKLCSQVFGKDAEKKGWKMVSHLPSGEEVWLSPSLKLWSAQSPHFQTHRQILEYSSPMTVSKEIYCHNPLTWGMRGYSTDQRWHVPSIEEFRLAEIEGYFDVVPNSEWETWSRDLDIEHDTIAFTFQKDYFGKGYTGGASRGRVNPESPRFDAIYVRCTLYLTPEDLR